MSKQYNKQLLTSWFNNQYQKLVLLNTSRIFRQNCILSTCSFTNGEKIEKIQLWIIRQRMDVGHYFMMSQYPVNQFTYGGIYSPLKQYLAYIIFYHATSSMVLANQKWKIFEAFNKKILRKKIIFSLQYLGLFSSFLINCWRQSIESTCINNISIISNDKYHQL